MLAGKRILLGVTGSIAAYKTPLLVRLLVKAGADVQVVLSESAKDFVTPLTLSTVSNRPVYSSFVKNENGEWANHVELGLWADLVLVAPASANTISKLAHGLCDNLLMATCLSARSPVAVSPAMDLDMHTHTATQTNFELLKKLGYRIIPAAEGELASGLSGVGRMPEPEELFAYIEKYFETASPLKGKKALVTAGPTYEPIDPVRFIGNHSSGKMGVAIAESLARKGAMVTLVHGPIGIEIPKYIHSIALTSSNEMLDACRKLWPESDIAVMAAAVADYRPAEMATEKIKKTDSHLHMELVKTVDILSEMGSTKKTGQLLVGFALETIDELSNAQQKLAKKNLDMVVLNSLRDTGAGFGHDTNKVTLLLKDNTTEEIALKPKTEIADDIVEKIIQLLA